MRTKTKIIDNKKSCARCNEFFIFEEFKVKTVNKNGLHSYCKKCRKLQNNDTPSSIERRKNRKSKDHRKSSIKEKRKWGNSQTYNYRRNYQLEKRYGITYEEYLILLEKQNNKCVICNKKETSRAKDGIIKALAVDHCHKTGKIRGLLCQKCNTAIGQLEDNLEIIDKAKDYLIQHQ